MATLIGREFITPKGNLFVITGETKRLLEIEVVEGPAEGMSLDITKVAFEKLVEMGHYREME